MHRVGLAGPDSPKWNADTTKADAEVGFGSKSMRLFPRERALTPTTASMEKAVERNGRISVDARVSSLDDIPADQLWLDIKADRAAKEKEAIEAERRVPHTSRHDVATAIAVPV